MARPGARRPVARDRARALVACRRAAAAVEGGRPGRGLLERRDRGRPHLHDGRPGRRAAAARVRRGRRRAAVEDAHRAGVERRVRRPARDADGRRRHGVRDRDRGRPGGRRGGDRQGALAPQPAARLRRPGDVGLEVVRVAARRRRPRDRHAGRARRRARRARQGHRQGDLARRAAGPRARRQGRRRLLVDRGLERHRPEAVRAARRPRPRRRARERRPVPVGLQPRRQRRREHLDADRARELGVRLDGLPDGSGARRAGARRTRASRRARSTS